MKTSIEISNLTKKRIDLEIVKKIVRKTVNLSGRGLDVFDLSIVFVGEEEIRKINWKYRQKKKSTDVLSFLLDSGYNKKRIENGKNYIGGEIILCPEEIAKNARESKVNFSRELAFVLAHGVLHVLGWRHGKKMYELQDKAVMRINE